MLQYNNLDQVAKCLSEQADSVAAIVVEPIAGNMGVVPPREGFLAGLRDLCTRYGALLVFDEVITGFRVAPGGAQELYGVTPDLTCLGKVIGGGLPVGAFGGPQAIMESLAPEGGVYQAGTLSGNPLAVAAGLTTLKLLQTGEIYRELESRSEKLAEGVKDILAGKGIPHTLHRVASMMSLFFNPGPVSCYEEVLNSDRGAFVKFFSRMLDQGIYLAPSAFEAWFVSAAHSEEDIEKTLVAVEESVQ